MKMDRCGLYIDGTWVHPTNFEPVINPATEIVIGHAPVGTLAEAEMAMAAARHSFTSGPWRRQSARQRQSKLQAFLDSIRARSGELMELIISEAGSTRALTEYLQYGIALKHAQHTIDICTRPAVTPLPAEINARANGDIWLGGGSLVRSPVGVVTAITPYNFPFFLNLGKIIPALAVGCSVILKPSPYTPFEALFLGEIADEVGLPKGILNIVTGGIDVAEILTTDPRIDLITFTGSDAVGAKIQAQAAPTLKRLIMELGGKSALIVREDADIKLAAAAGLGGFTTHAGQGCTLLTRHLVHNSVKAEYIAHIKDLAQHIKIGNPADAGVSMGPLIRDVQRQRTENYVQLAQDEGAHLVLGGKRPAHLDKGFFFEPTLFDNVHNHFRIAREEVFGPIGVVIGFDSDEDAVAIANDSDFGLSGGIFSRNVGKAYEMALQMDTGNVSLNGGTGTMSSTFPFGGIKRSGFGREYGEAGLFEFTYLKTIGFHAG